MSKNYSKYSYKSNHYSCKKLVNVLDKQIKEISYDEFSDILLPYLKEKHRNTDLETLGISLDMTLSEISDHVYTINVFDTIEEMKSIFQDNFVIFTDYYYEECISDKDSEEEYYKNVIYDFINNKKIMKMIEDVVLFLVKDRQLDAGIDLKINIALVESMDYEYYKSGKEPLLKAYLSVDNAYKLIKNDYLDTGKISRALLDVLAQVVSSLAQEDTEAIIRDMEYDYDEYKLYFSNWLSFRNMIYETKFSINEMRRILEVVIGDSNYKEVKYFVKDKNFFVTVMNNIVRDRYIMIFLDDVYIETMKNTLEKDKRVTLEVKEKNNKFELTFRKM